MTRPSRRDAVGTLLCVGVRGAGPEDPRFRADVAACRSAGIGGIILFDIDVRTWREREKDGVADDAARRAAVRNVTGPDQVLGLTRALRDELGDDVIIAIDQEGGHAARLAPARGFPDAPSAADMAELNAVERGVLMQAQADLLRDLGVTLNFAPCIDVAVNADNDVIVRQGRSFSSMPDDVIACAEDVIAAHERAGVAWCLKHFPGHGSSRADSHHELPDITSTYDGDRELLVYRTLIQRHRVPAVMVGHLLHRGWDQRAPASLSRAITMDILRRDLGFEGVIVTDSIDMQAVLDDRDLTEVVIAALNAGADMIVHGFNAPDRPDEHPAERLRAAIVEGVESNAIDGGWPRIEASATLIRERIAPSRSPR